MGNPFLAWGEQSPADPHPHRVCLGGCRSLDPQKSFPWYGRFHRTAVGHRPTAVGSRLTAVGRRSTAVSHCPTAAAAEIGDVIYSEATLSIVLFNSRPNT